MVFLRKMYPRFPVNLSVFYEVMDRIDILVDIKKGFDEFVQLVEDFYAEDDEE